MRGKRADPITAHDSATTNDSVGACEMSLDYNDGRSRVLRIAGQVDGRSRGEFEAQLCAQLDQPARLRRLVVDVGAVELFALPCVAALRNVERRCAARSVWLCLVDCPPPVAEALDTAGLADHFRRYPTAVAAGAHPG